MRVGGGCTWGEVDARDRRARPGDAERDHLDHRRRRPHARRRPRPPDPQVRPDDRQPARGRASCSRAASGCARAPTRTPTSSGRSAAAAATSASSPRSSSGCTRSGTVVGGPTFWPVEQGAEVLRGLPRLPAERAARAERLLRLPHRCRRRRRSRRSSTCARSAASSGATSGDRRTPPEAMAPLLDALPGAAAARRRSRCRTPALQSAFDAALPGRRPVVLARRLRQGDPRRGGRGPRASSAPRCRRWQSTMHLYPIDGAAHDVGPSDTAWSYRDATWGSVFAGVDPDPANVGRDPPLERRLLRGAAPLLGRRRLREHDDGRGPGAGAGELPRQLRPPRPDQGDLRPGQPLPGQPEHPAARRRHCGRAALGSPSYIPSAARASTNRSTAKSRSSSVCAADICVRMRAVPRGTTG